MILRPSTGVSGVRGHADCAGSGGVCFGDGALGPSVLVVRKVLGRVGYARITVQFRSRIQTVDQRNSNASTPDPHSTPGHTMQSMINRETFEQLAAPLLPRFKEVLQKVRCWTFLTHAYYDGTCQYVR